MKKKARISLWIKFGIFAAIGLFAVYLVLTLALWAASPKPERVDPTNFWEALAQAIGEGIDSAMWLCFAISIIVLVYCAVGVFVTLFTLYKLKTATKIEDMKGLPVVNLFLGGFIAGIIMLGSNPDDWVNQGPEVTI